MFRKRGSMPSRAHGPTVLRVTPHAGPVLMCCLAALIAALQVGSYARAAKVSWAADGSPGTREFGEGEIWRYGRQRREVSAGEERDHEDGWLASGRTCSGEDVYQEDIIMDDWSRSFHRMSATADDRSYTAGKSHPQRSKATHGREHKHRLKHHERRYYRTKKAARVEMDRRVRRDPEERSRVRRGATAQEARLWPGGIVPYEIPPDCDEDTKNLVLRSMRHWEEYTCIQFVPRSNETAYVHFVFAGGCCSFVGRAGARQVVSLGPGCEYFGTILHELGHVIGFWHEQSRPDRDEYVTVYEANVSPGKHFNFRRFDHRVINSLDQPYDYDSVMHYGTWSFSRNHKRTIIPKKDSAIGQHGGISVGDILQANLLYRCTKVGDCGGTVFKSSGQLTSPHYPEPFAPNTTCDWALAVDEGLALKLLFMDIDLPIDKDGECSGGYVEVREGQGELGRLIGRYCGSTLPAPVTVDSGRAWLRFRAGTSAEFQSRAGFAATLLQPL